MKLNYDNKTISITHTVVQHDNVKHIETGKFKAKYINSHLNLYIFLLDTSTSINVCQLNTHFTMLD